MVSIVLLFSLFVLKPSLEVVPPRPVLLVDLGLGELERRVVDSVGVLHHRADDVPLSSVRTGSSIVFQVMNSQFSGFGSTRWYPSPLPTQTR